MDISPEELRHIKRLNQQAKGIGGEVTITWDIAHKIDKWAIKASESGESIYNSNPANQGGELRD